MNMPFKTDIEAIRNRARKRMEDGPVTDAYKADRERVIDVLQQILATELVCNLRYRNHYFMASGIMSQPVADEFLEHANEEQQHADLVAKRITQLGGNPDFSPESLRKRSHAEYSAGHSLADMIAENLVAERVAIETYSEIVRWLGDSDSTTRTMVEGILRQEEEHADDLAGLLDRVDADTARLVARA
ncbi:MAG: bacterioferritin [Alphaproteobacteria bacterium]